MKKYLLWAGLALVIILMFGGLIAKLLAFLLKLVLFVALGAVLVAGAFYLVRWLRTGYNAGRFRR